MPGLIRTLQWNLAGLAGLRLQTRDCRPMLTDRPGHMPRPRRLVSMAACRHPKTCTQADIEPSRAEAKKLQPTSMSTVRFEPIIPDLTSTLGLAECVLKNDFVTSEGKKVASSRRDRLSARISRHKVPRE